MYLAHHDLESITIISVDFVVIIFIIIIISIVIIIKLLLFL